MKGHNKGNAKILRKILCLRHWLVFLTEVMIVITPTKWTIVIYDLKLFVNWPEDNRGHQSKHCNGLLTLHETSESFRKLY